MTEKEKVILGLECCIRKMEGQRVCDECPYDEDFNCLGCSIVLWQAIAMLREQKPTTLENDGHHIRCTNCGEYWCKTDIEGNRFPDRFCPNCGRRVK